jgi:hypothetical protein
LAVIAARSPSLRGLRRLAAGSGCGRQLGDPLLVPLLALGRLGLQHGVGLLQPGQPASRAGQAGRELVPPTIAMLAVLALVGFGSLAQDLGDLVLEFGLDAVGPLGGVADHLGAGQRGLVADPEADDGHMVGCAVAGQDPEGRSSRQRRSICREERTPMARKL